MNSLADNLIKSMQKVNLIYTNLSLVRIFGYMRVLFININEMAYSPTTLIDTDGHQTRPLDVSDKRESSVYIV